MCWPNIMSQSEHGMLFYTLSPALQNVFMVSCVNMMWNESLITLQVVESHGSKLYWLSHIGQTSSLTSTPETQLRKCPYKHNTLMTLSACMMCCPLVISAAYENYFMTW